MRGLLLGSLAALSISSTSAHPSQRKAGVSKRAIDIESFRLKVSADYVDAAAVDANPPQGLTKRANAQDIATELVKKTAPGAEFRQVESYTGDNGVTHVYFRQTANDLDIDNADFNVNVSITQSFLADFGNNTLTYNRLGAMEPSSLSETRSTRARSQRHPTSPREIASIRPAL